LENIKNKIENEEQDCNCNNAKDDGITENEILKQSIEEKDRQTQDYYDQLLRLKADFENYRKRSEKEKIDYLEWGKEKILLKQLFIYDILEQALKSAKKTNNLESIIIGIEMIGKEFSKMLKEEGVEEIQCEKFDPNTCEALEQVEVEDEVEEGRILETYQKGYRINGNLIRTAKVKVAKSIKNKI
jgi:molecular chaperone GrpE